MIHRQLFFTKAMEDPREIFMSGTLWVYGAFILDKTQLYTLPRIQSIAHLGYVSTTHTKFQEFAKALLSRYDQTSAWNYTTRATEKDRCDSTEAECLRTACHNFSARTQSVGDQKSRKLGANSQCAKHSYPAPGPTISNKRCV